MIRYGNKLMKTLNSGGIVWKVLQIKWISVLFILFIIYCNCTDWCDLKIANLFCRASCAIFTEEPNISNTMVGFMNILPLVIFGLFSPFIPKISKNTVWNLH